jgi:antitoxin (DNA-binding transcriptional repressor) of toxin-antitoxin stability system
MTITMSSVTVDVTTLPGQVRDLEEEAIREGEVMLMSGGEAVAKFVAVEAKRPRQPGSACGLIHMADDFDEPLDAFRDYM